MLAGHQPVLRAMAERTTFTDIFEVAAGNADGTCPMSFTSINTATGFECLKLKVSCLYAPNTSCHVFGILHSSDYRLTVLGWRARCNPQHAQSTACVNEH